MSESIIPSCPECQSEFAYAVTPELYACPECGYEWNLGEEQENIYVVTDMHGTVLQDGDNVIIMKDIPVKGASSGIKAGTKVRNIRIITGVNNHNIDCTLPGFGGLLLKSEFVKKIVNL